MLRVLESQAPPRQYAGETIDTFSNRLVNATLLEDKRQAILGLRSFAKEYPATVASGGLKALIEAFASNVDDVDTGKIVLETLLGLFNPNDDSPEADDDIALLVADQLTQRQDHVTALLDLLENTDYYARLYALRLILATHTARPDRTQDCIQNAPLGIPRLVAVLDDTREAIRTAGLDLLNEVTESSVELQKIVAFQDAFARIFALIEAEGSLAEGGVVVQDCLNLLANLLRLNTSNQTTFREEGFVPRLADLFKEEQSEDDFGDIGPSQNKEKNIWGILAVLRMFLVRGSIGTQANQFAFVKHRILDIVMQLAFDATVSAPIRAEALRTCGDMVRNNARLQEGFGNMQVPFERNSAPQANGASTNGHRQSNGTKRNQEANGERKSPEMIHVMEALLELALSTHSIALFDVRFAAVEVIEAYIDNHNLIREHFLNRAISGHNSEVPENENIVSILMGGPHAYSSSDPYRIWFAAIIALRLIHEDTDAKETLRSVSEGNEEEGEEVVTCIQIMTGHLVSSFQQGLDERILTAYLMLLNSWLFEDAAAVNDLLSEGSTLQSLVALASKPDKERAISRGLAAALVGVVYEFSTKDSPIPRTKLQPLLTSGLGREQYVQGLARLREQPALRDFEVISQNLSTAPMPGMLPEIYFDDTFVAFFKDNYSRLNRALDKDPKKEVVLQAEAGVDRDVVDSLRDEIKSLQSELDGLKSSHETDILERDKAINSTSSELRRAQDEAQRIKNINESLRKGHDEEMAAKDSESRSATERLRQEHSRTVREATAKATADLGSSERRRQEMEQAHAKKVQEFERQTTLLERTVKGHEDTMGRLKAQVTELQNSKKEADNEINKRGGRIMAMENEKAVIQESLDLANANIQKLERETENHERSIKEARNSAAEARKELNDALEETSIANEQIRELQAKEKENDELLASIEREKDARISSLEKQLAEKEEQRKAAQTELDDLFVVLGDVEEKRTRDKKKLKELGATISDAESEDEEGEEEEADDGEDQDEEGGDAEEKDEDEEAVSGGDEDGEEHEEEGHEEDDDEDEASDGMTQTNQKPTADPPETKKVVHERESSVD